MVLSWRCKCVAIAFANAARRRCNGVATVLAITGALPWTSCAAASTKRLHALTFETDGYGDDGGNDDADSGNDGGTESGYNVAVWQ